MRKRLWFLLVCSVTIAFTSVVASAAIPSASVPQEAVPRPEVAPAPVAAGRPATAGTGVGATTTASPQSAPREFTVLGAGDILIDPGLRAQGRRDAVAGRLKDFDFDPIFASAVPRIQAADLAICHVETPMAPVNDPHHGYPILALPTAIATTIHDIGYDTCSTASNHSLDDREAGIDRTLDALDAAGVKHCGTARSAAEASTPDLLNVNGVAVAQLSYAAPVNGVARPADKPWLANPLNVTDILAAAHQARQDGAEVVIVSLHFGTEYQLAPNARQLSVAKALLASPDVDLILGSHAHVVQPFQKINGKWIAYGMGNQVAAQRAGKPTQDGVMPEFTFTEISPGHFQVTKAEAIPTYDGLARPIRLIDIAAELTKPNLNTARKALYVASWKRTAHAVDALSAAKDGLVIAGAGSL
jgi:poly-gamma-glutamate synthesis protein (capsule biosynthesis protein)